MPGWNHEIAIGWRSKKNLKFLSVLFILGIEKINNIILLRTLITGDYGIQRFVGNFGAIVFAPFGGYIIDVSTKDGTGYEAVIYIYLALKLIASLFILLIKLDFKPPGMFV